MKLTRKEGRSPKLAAYDEDGAANVRVLTGIMAGISMALLSVIASPPGWWDAQGVRDLEQIQDNRAAVTAGQLKNFAVKAKEEMDEKFEDQGGAGATIDTMVGEWYESSGVPKSADNQYVAATVGQLKAVAKPFYDRLSEMGLRPSGSYPWSNTAPAAENYAVANAGQVKNVFAFEIPDRRLNFVVVAGNNQNGHTGGTLALPLKVRYRAGTQPLVGKSVTFRVPTVAGAPAHSGQIRGPSSQTWLQSVVVSTDEQGYAEVLMKMPGDTEGPYAAAIEAATSDPILTVTFTCNLVPRVVPPTNLVAEVKEDGTVELTWARGSGDTGAGYIVERRTLFSSGSSGAWGNVSQSLIQHATGFTVRADDPYYLDVFPFTGRIGASATGFEYRVKSTGAATSQPSASASVTWNTDGDSIPDWVEWLIIRYKKQYGDATATSLAYVTDTTKRLTGTGQTDKTLWQLGQVTSHIWGDKMSYPGLELRGEYGYLEKAATTQFNTYLLGDTGLGFEGYIAGDIKFKLTRGGAAGATVRGTENGTPSNDYSMGTTTVVTDDNGDGTYSQHDLVDAYCQVLMPDTANQTVVMRASVPNRLAEERIFVYRTHEPDLPPEPTLTFSLTRISQQVVLADPSEVYPEPLKVKCVASDSAQQAQSAGKTVRFFVDSDTALLSSTGQAEGMWRTWIDATTDSDGFAQVWAKAPVGLGATSMVYAGLATSAPYAISFSAQSQPLPAAPTVVRWSVNSDGSVVLTWQDQSNNETGFSIQKAEKKVDSESLTWQDAFTTGSGVTSWTDTSPATSNLSASTEGFRYRIASIRPLGHLGWQDADKPVGSVHHYVVTWDTDVDSLPDWFERRISLFDSADEIPNVATVLTGDDYDGDGATNRQEWLDGTNPVGLSSSLRLVKTLGDQQQSLNQGELLPQPFEVVVLSSGQPVPSANVVFTPQNGTRLGIDFLNLAESPVTVSSDATGKARVFAQAPITQGQSSAQPAFHFATATTTPSGGNAVSQKFNGRMHVLKDVLAIESGDRQSAGVDPLTLVVKLTDPLTATAVVGKTITFTRPTTGSFYALQSGQWTSSASANVDAVTNASGLATIKYEPDVGTFNLIVRARVADQSFASVDANEVQFLINPSSETDIAGSFTLTPTGAKAGGEFTKLTLNLTRGTTYLGWQTVTFKIASGFGALSSAAIAGNKNDVASEFVVTTDALGMAEVYFQHPTFEATTASPNHESIVHAIVAGGDVTGSGEAVAYACALQTTPAVPSSVLPADVLLGVAMHDERKIFPLAAFEKRIKAMTFAGRQLVVSESDGANHQLKSYYRAPGLAGWQSHQTIDDEISADQLSYDRVKGALIAAQSWDGLITKYALDYSTAQFVPVRSVLEPIEMNGSLLQELLPVGRIFALSGDLFAVTPGGSTHRLADGEQQWVLFNSYNGSEWPIASVSGFGRWLVQGTPTAFGSNGPASRETTAAFQQRSTGDWGRGLTLPLESWDRKMSGSGDLPGTSLAVSGDYLVIGESPISRAVSNLTSTTAWQEGGLTIYRLVAGTWALLQKIPLLKGFRDGRVKVAMDGDHLTVAAYGAHPYLNTSAAHMDGDTLRGASSGTAPEEGTPVERLYIATYRPDASGLFVEEQVIADQQTFHDVQGNGIFPQEGVTAVSAGRYAFDIAVSDGIVAVNFPKAGDGLLNLYESAPNISESVDSSVPLFRFSASSLYPLAANAEDITLVTSNPNFVLEEVAGTGAWAVRKSATANLDALSYGDDPDAIPEEAVFVEAKLSNVTLEQREFRVAIEEAALEAPSHLAVTNSGTTDHLLTWQDNATHETGFEVDRRTYPSEPEGDTWTTWTSVSTSIAAHVGTGEVTSALAKPSGAEAVEYRVRARKANSNTVRQSAYSNPGRIGEVPGSGPADSDEDGVPDDVEIAEGTDPYDDNSNSRSLIDLVVKTPLSADP